MTTRPRRSGSSSDEHRLLAGHEYCKLLIKGNVPRVCEWLLKVPMSQVLISAVTEAELLFGAARKCDAVRLKTAIGELLLRADSLAWDSNAKRHYADLRAVLEIGGIPLGNLPYEDRGSRVVCRSRSGNARSFLQSTEALENRGLDKIETGETERLTTTEPCLASGCSYRKPYSPVAECSGSN
jgi:hypothetical protein